MIAALSVLAVTLQTTHPHSEATLVSSMTTVVAGRPFLVGIQMKMDPSWHCYWLYPGDSGIPTTVDWKLPNGWKAGPIMWPTPHRLEASGLVNYGYEHSTLLLVRITPPANAKAGSEVSLRGTVKWLICQAGCLAASESVSKTVRIGRTDVVDRVWSPNLNETLAGLPSVLTGASFTAEREKNTITLTMVAPSETVLAVKASFFAADESIEPSAPQPVKENGNVISWKLKVSEFAPAQIVRLKGLLVAPKGSTWGHGKDAIVVDTPVELNRG